MVGLCSSISASPQTGKPISDLQTESISSDAGHTCPPSKPPTPRVTAASDWYSMGVMLFEVLTGRLPFLGNGAERAFGQAAVEPPAPVDLAADMPEDLNALCVDLLRRQPKERPGGHEILRRLGFRWCGGGSAVTVTVASSATAAGLRQPTALVGRTATSRGARGCSEATCLGRTVALLPPWALRSGKDRALQNFLDRRLNVATPRSSPVVATSASRCRTRHWTA